MRHQSGVTLIELMVVVIVMGLLAAIAVPSYQNYVRQANRAEARGILMENAQFMERNFTVSNDYSLDPGGIAIALPYTQSPKSGTAKYTITANPLDADSFTLNAAPTGTMTGDECGTLTLDQTGTRGAGGSIADCWER